jgi:hypothetical protein
VEGVGAAERVEARRSEAKPAAPEPLVELGEEAGPGGSGRRGATTVVPLPVEDEPVAGIARIGQQADVGEVAGSVAGTPQPVCQAGFAKTMLAPPPEPDQADSAP